MTDSNRKVIVPDTNIFLHDSDSIFAFPGQILMIPLEVIEEIDDQKRRGDEVGRHARRTSRLLDELRARGSLSEGVDLDNGCTVRVAFGDKRMECLPPSLRNNKEDNRILATALSIQDKYPDNQVVFMSKDINMRIKADTIGLTSMDYEEDKIDLEELYMGYDEIEIDAADFKRLKDKGSLPLDVFKDFTVNQIAVATSGGNTAYLRIDAEAKAAVPLKVTLDDVIAGIKPLNPEQLFAFELLLDPRIDLVTLNGKAGTGKTLLALAAGVRQVLEDSLYQKLLVSRPIIPMGKEMGFLPGGVEEKLDPWMTPLYDNFEIIFSVEGRKNDRDKRHIKEIISGSNLIQIEALSYIRGRSLPNQYMVVDEAQNLSPLEVKTIITRAGKGTKIVLTGDPYQIDHPYLDQNSNGLNYAVERFKNSPLAGHVTLVKGERSELAETAAQLL
jgi:PhoH-like ATPase